MRIVRRAPITLLEVMIALALSVLLITTLSHFFWQVNQAGDRTERLQYEEFSRRYAQNRLSFLFLSAQPEHKHSKNFFFFSSTPAGTPYLPGSTVLTFMFDNSASDRVDRADIQLGRLFVNPQKQLCLASWPLRKGWKDKPAPDAHLEIMMEGINNLSFAFFTPPERDRHKIVAKLSKGAQNIKREILPPAGEWVTAWKQEYMMLPPLIKMALTKESGEKITFAFPLPLSSHLVIYEQ